MSYFVSVRWGAVRRCAGDKRCMYCIRLNWIVFNAHLQPTPQAADNTNTKGRYVRWTCTGRTRRDVTSAQQRALARTHTRTLLRVRALRGACVRCGYPSSLGAQPTENAGLRGYSMVWYAMDCSGGMGAAGGEGARESENRSTNSSVAGDRAHAANTCACVRCGRLRAM